MLKKILSPETCAACRLCCRFDASDIWELPVLPPETVQAVQKLKPETEFMPMGTECTFAAPPLEGDALYTCPMLTESGCGLSPEDKPFDCKIWPFRVMQQPDGTHVIAVCELCKGIGELSDEQLRAFLEEGLGEQCLAYAERHPSHIKPLKEGYHPIPAYRWTAYPTPFDVT